MPLVERVRWRPFRVPFTAEFRASYGTLVARDGLILEVVTDEGVRGLGEASPLPLYSGGSLEDCRAVVRSLAPLLVGKRMGAAWEVGATGPSAVPGVAGGSLGPALAGLQSAAADAEARTRGTPVAELLAERLGGERRAETAPIPINGLIGDGDPAAAAADALRLAGEGFRTVKVKVGLDHPRDLARLEAVRGAAGPTVRLRLDANGAFSEEQALRRLRDYAAFDIELVEQPVSSGPGAWDAMARLRGATGLRLAADESVRSVADFEAFRAREAMDPEPPFVLAPLVGAGGSQNIDVVVIKPMLLGLADSLAIIRGCSGEPALDVVVTSSFDTGVGVAMAVHLAAAIPPGRRLPCGLDTLRFLENSLVRPANANVTGPIATPVGPGLGVELDRPALERYATGPWEGVEA